VLPERVEDLVPEYLDSVPEDPVTGKALRYRAASDAYVVYSVGPDGKDDGGKQLRETPVPARATLPAGTDMGIRVVIRK